MTKRQAESLAQRIMRNVPEMNPTATYSGLRGTWIVVVTDTDGHKILTNVDWTRAPA